MTSKTGGNANLDAVGKHYSRLLEQHGTTSEGVGWGSVQRQEERFRQIARALDCSAPFSLLDIGCGYGAFFDHLAAAGAQVDFLGVDIAPDMIMRARALHVGNSGCRFETGTMPEGMFDYVVASGIFNVMRAPSPGDWETYVFNTLRDMYAHSRKAMACNFLTSYSDPDRKENNLYYADPCKILDFCITELSKNTALNHHYNIWDFTVHVFKDA